MAGKEKKRRGKKHRQASTRPKMGKSTPKTGATTGAVSPKKRKELAAKKAAALIEAKKPTKSPDRERRVVIRQGDGSGSRGYASAKHAPREHDGESVHEERQWREAEQIATRLTLPTETEH